MVEWPACNQMERANPSCDPLDCPESTTKRGGLPMRRFSTWRRLAFVVLLGLVVSVTALVRAAQTTSVMALLTPAPMSGPAMVARLNLSGAAADAFLKAWDEEQKTRAAVLIEARDAVAALAQADATKGMDRVQSACVHLMDNYARSTARLAGLLTEEQQARLVGGGTLYRIARMEGMRQALPALVDLGVDELVKRSGMDEVARRKAGAVRAKMLARAMDLVAERAQLKEKLSEPAQRGATLAALAKNHLEMAEALAEGLRALRGEVADAQSARMILALAGTLH